MSRWIALLALLFFIVRVLPHITARLKQERTTVGALAFIIGSALILGVFVAFFLWIDVLTAPDGQSMLTVLFHGDSP